MKLKFYDPLDAISETFILANILAKKLNLTQLKLALYGTDGRLFRNDISDNFSHVTQKLGQISKIRPKQI